MAAWRRHLRWVHRVVGRVKPWDVVAAIWLIQSDGTMNACTILYVRVSMVHCYIASAVHMTLIQCFDSLLL